MVRVQSPTRNPVPWDQTSPRTESARWNNVKTLAQAAVDATKALNPTQLSLDGDGDVDPCELYDRLYARYIGPVYRKAVHNPRTVRTVYASQRFCADQGLDFALYIAAQMDALADWCKTFKPKGAKRPLGFQPSMLMGDKAVARYNAYLRRADSRFHRTDEDTLPNFEKHVRDETYAAELSVASHYVASIIGGEPMTWAESVQSAAANDIWVAVQTEGRHPSPTVRALYPEIVRGRDREWVLLLRRAAMLNAASQIASRYAPGLAERIGLARNVFSWDAFAQLIQSVFEGRKPRREPSPGIFGCPGIFWGSRA